jgi:hypothetical protein
MNKVYGGTPVGNKSLCATCRMAHHVRGIDMQEQLICRGYQNTLFIRFPVETCSIYDDKRVPSLYQMEQIAWAVTSRSRGAVGFGGQAANEIHIEPPQTQIGQPGVAPPITGLRKS